MTLSRYQLERTDLLTEIEQGRKVEQELFQENTRGMNTLGNLLFSRWWSKTEAIRKWQARQDYVPGPPIREAGPNPHQFPCEDPFCWRCEAGVKRLLRDCDLLPVGEPDRAHLSVEPLIGRLKIPTRYRRDESDK